MIRTALLRRRWGIDAVFAATTTNVEMVLRQMNHPISQVNPETISCRAAQLIVGIWRDAHNERFRVARIASCGLLRACDRQHRPNLVQPENVDGGWKCLWGIRGSLAAPTWLEN